MQLRRKKINNIDFNGALLNKGTLPKNQLRGDHLKIHQLENGITAILEPISGVKTLALGFWFNCGSRYEQKGEHGISHFTEHLLFKGTNTKTAYNIACAFDKTGGYVNAFTDKEQVCLHAVVPTGYEQSVLTICIDMIEHSILPKDECERERRVIQSEIISSADDPEETAFDMIIKALFPKNSLGKPVLGSLSDVKNLTHDQLFTWYQKYFAKAPYLVTISGNFDERIIISTLKNCKLKTTPTQLTKNTYPFVQPQWKSGFQHITASFKQTQIFYSIPLVVPQNIRDYYALLILNSLFGDTMSSRLFQSLREKGGFSYNVYSFFNIFSDTAYWGAYATSDKKNISTVLSIMVAEFQNLCTVPLTDEEILTAKEHVYGEEIINSADADYRMKLLARHYFMNFAPIHHNELLLLIRSITKAELIDYLNRNLSFQKASTIIYGPAISEKTKKTLKSLY